MGSRVGSILNQEVLNKVTEVLIKIQRGLYIKPADLVRYEFVSNPCHELQPYGCVGGFDFTVRKYLIELKGVWLETMIYAVIEGNVQ